MPSLPIALAPRTCKVCGETLLPRRVIVHEEGRNPHRVVRFFHFSGSQCKYKRGALPLSLQQD